MMYGVDCEMVETKEGKELGHVCVLNSNCEVVIDVLVKPSNPVVDYLTQFSGLTKEALDKATLSLQDVHKLLKERLPSGAILVGHSLEYDLRVLHLVHQRCIDTTVLYPHNREGLKFSLKRLTELYLNKRMKRAHGHDPREDAQAALLLALKKIENGPGFGVPMTQIVPLASAIRKLHRDSSVAVGNAPDTRVKRKAATAVEEPSTGTSNGIMFLVDSFKYDSLSSFQVTLKPLYKFVKSLAL